MKSKILFILVFFAIVAKSQSLKERIADKHFNALEFAVASEIYEDLANSKHSKNKYLLRAAECNLKITNYNKAKIYYDAAYSSTNKLSDNDLYNYYQVLRYTSNYFEAREIFSKINSNKYELIRNNLAKKKLNLQELKKDSSNYVLKRLTINSDDSDFSPYVLNNEMYFLSARRNTSIVNRKYGWDNSYFLDIYKGTIEGTDVKNAALVKKEGLKTKVHEGPMCYTSDGNKQYITRNNFVDGKIRLSEIGQVNLKIFWRQKKEGIWSDWISFPFNSDEYSCADPAVTGDGKTMYFASDMPGTNGLTDIWVTNYSNGVWSKPENLGPVINSEGREVFPHLYEDEVLFYSSDGKVGLGGLDIFYTIPTVDAYFEAQNMGYPINSNFDDFGFYAKNLTHGYISSNRGKTNDDIFSFVSKHPVVSRSSIKFIVRDSFTKEIIPNATIVVSNQTKKKGHNVKTDSTGEFKFNFLNAEGFGIVADKEGYNETSFVVKKEDLVIGTDLKKEILLEKRILGLIGSIVNAENDIPIEGVKITITDNFNKTDFVSFLTDNDGGFEHLCKNKKIGDTLSFLIKLEKNGYLTKMQSFDFIVKREALIRLNDVLNIKMYRPKLGTDIGKIVNLQPIYFDFGKSIVRLDAKLELDKIVLLMKQNGGIVIELSSHSDCRGGANENMILSDRRAKASANYIISKGISPTRIYGKGYGESKLINDCKCEGKLIVPCEEEQHAQNRRTEFKIVKIKS